MRRPGRRRTRVGPGHTGRGVGGPRPDQPPGLLRRRRPAGHGRPGRLRPVGRGAPGGHGRPDGGPPVPGPGHGRRRAARVVGRAPTGPWSRRSPPPTLRPGCPGTGRRWACSRSSRPGSWRPGRTARTSATRSGSSARPPTGCEHIAHLGVRARPFSYLVRGREVPAGPHRRRPRRARTATSGGGRSARRRCRRRRPHAVATVDRIGTRLLPGRHPAPQRRRHRPGRDRAHWPRTGWRSPRPSPDRRDRVARPPEHRRHTAGAIDGRPPAEGQLASVRVGHHLGQPGHEPVDVGLGGVERRHPPHDPGGLVPHVEGPVGLERLGHRRRAARRTPRWPAPGGPARRRAPRRRPAPRRAAMALACGALRSHRSSVSRATNWAATNRIFDDSCIDCLRTNRSEVVGLGPEGDDRLGAERPVLRAAEGERRRRRPPGRTRRGRRRGTAAALAIRAPSRCTQHALGRGPTRPAPRSRRRCRRCRPRCSG